MATVSGARSVFSPRRSMDLGPRRSLDLGHTQRTGQSTTHVPAIVRRRLSPLCGAASSGNVEGSGSATQQEQQPRAGSPCPLDTNYWHYGKHMHWWQQRAFVVPAGLMFILAADLLEGFTLKNTFVAAVPVLAFWYLALVLLPRQFKSYCNDWAATHPEEMKQAERPVN